MYFCISKVRKSSAKPTGSFLRLPVKYNTLMNRQLWYLTASVFVLIINMPFFSLSQPDPGSAENQTDSKGRKQGLWKKKDADGILLYEGHFRDDLPVGEFIYYYPDGKLRSTLNHLPDGKTAQNVSYYPNGKKMAEGIYLEKQKEGPWKYNNDAGSLASEELYEAGIPVGCWKVYYDGLKLMEEVCYTDGKKEGAWKQYFLSGSLKAEAKYSKGQLQGEAAFYYPDGSLMARGSYQDDVRTGTWVNFKQNGQKESEFEFENGNLIRETFYDKAREKELRQDVQKIRTE